MPTTSSSGALPLRATHRQGVQEVSGAQSCCRPPRRQWAWGGEDPLLPVCSQPSSHSFPEHPDEPQTTPKGRYENHLRDQLLRLIDFHSPCLRTVWAAQPGTPADRAQMPLGAGRPRVGCRGQRRGRRRSDQLWNQWQAGTNEGREDPRSSRWTRIHVKPEFQNPKIPQRNTNGLK